MDKAEQPTITRADRDAAVEFAKGLYGKREGEILTKRMVEIFARHFAHHRTASMATQDGLVEALKKIPTAALYALRHGQQQADMDGTFVTISRQALEEVLDAVEAALSAIKGDKS